MLTTHQCKNCKSSFNITDEDIAFYEKLSPTFAGKKYQIPHPTLCPDCRTQRRMSWRNERKLYKRKCDASGKSIIAAYSEDKPFKVYEQSVWWGDQWDAMSYGQEIDFSRSFLEQVKELITAVPMQSLNTDFASMINSDYNNQVGHLKNCYLIFNADYDEDCYYGKGVNRCFKCVDNHKIYDCEMLYECANCNSCSLSHYLFDSERCNNCFFSTNLLNCDHCFGCFNLVGQKYYFFNKKLSPEERETQRKEYLHAHSHEEILKIFQEFASHRIVRSMESIHAENSSGNYLKEVSNCHDCYDCENTTDSKYCSDIKKGDKISANNQDISYFGVGISNAYENESIGYDVDHIFFSSSVWDKINNFYYCFSCFSNSSNLFGCVGLRNKEYCILNKQYTKAEYESLSAKIIEQMMKAGERGEFFPIAMSPYAYNETLASEYFPLSKNQALEKGYQWKDEEDKNFQGQIYIPLSIDQYNPNKGEKHIAEKNMYELLNGIIKCEISGRFFRIIKQELDFYIANNLPIPHKHPDIRHIERLNHRNPRKLRDRTCMKCGIDIKTTYSPERKEIVRCEVCYNKEIYG